MPGTIGDNQPSLDRIVEENRQRGLYLSQLACLTRAVGDPRLQPRHLRVLARLIEYTNAKSGMAYPGRARLARDIIYYENGEPQRYSEGTIAVTLSELGEFGFVISDRRAPEGHGRALAHYATVTPATDELQRAITAWCEDIRGQPRRKFPTGAPSDVKTGVNVKTLPDVKTGLNLSPENRPHVNTGVNVKTDLNISPDVKTGLRADVKTGMWTVTCSKRTGREEDPVSTVSNPVASLTDNRLGPCLNAKATLRAAPADASAPDIPEVSETELAVAAYNEAADAEGFIRCPRLTPPLRKLLDTRLGDIGGVEEFKRAVGAVHRHDFLAGRVRQDGRQPFKLDLGYLLRTDGKMGDVLALLLGLAASPQLSAPNTTRAKREYEEQLARVRAEEDAGSCRS
jgi:hypothetical protein